MVRLTMFGGARLHRDGVPVSGRAAQSHHLALLALLASSPGRSATRDKLVGYLWPEREPRKARHRLSVALHVIRRALGNSCIVASGDVLELNPEAVRTDVDALHEAVEEGRFEDAVGIYAGPFLDGFFVTGALDFERWVHGEQERCADLYRSALEGLVEEAEEASDLEAAVGWWRKLAANDPYGVPTAVGVVRALAAVGDTTGALRHAHAHAALVTSDLGLSPNPEVLELATRLVREAEERIEGSEGSEGSEGDDPGDPAVPPRHTHAHPPARVPTSRARPPPHPGGRRLDGRRPALLATVCLLVVAAGAGWWTASGGGWTASTEGGHESSGATAASGGRAATEPPLPTSVAVLPFASPDGPPELAVLGARLAERVRATLAYVPGLHVIPGDSLSRFGDAPDAAAVGRALGVARVVDGAVRSEGGRILVTARLLDLPGAERSWSASYDRPSADGAGDADVDRAAIEEEVSLAIADGLRLRLVPYEPNVYTENQRAYDRFLQGVYAMRRHTSEDLWQALQFHREAWEEDPAFALAHAIAGNAHISLGAFGVAPEIAFENAREHVLEALALDSLLAEGHAALGRIQIWWDLDFENGERSLRRAIALYPTLPQARSWYGHYLLFVRDLPEPAVEYVRMALEVDPLNTARSHALERALYWARRFDEVPKQNRVTWSLDAEVAGSLRSSPLGDAYRELGRYDEAIDEFQRLHERIGGPAPVGLAVTYARMGREEEARGILREWETRVQRTGESGMALARIHAALGQVDQAFRWLEWVYDRKPYALFRLRVDPVFDPLRADPRFDEMLARIGLPLRS